jgi:cytoskeletal protein RodZ
VFEIGYSLKAARERQGIGLPEAELATKIRAKYIRALEEEDFDALPADTYARGFLRTYADYLGLDGEIYVDEYASRFHNAEWEDEPRRAPRRSRPRRERTVERRAVVLVLAGIAVLSALVFVAFRFGNAPSNGPTLPNDHNSAVGIVLHGVGHGTHVVVRQGSNTGKTLFRGMLTPGRVEPFTGKRFWWHARRPSGVRISQSPGVTLLGG